MSLSCVLPLEQLSYLRNVKQQAWSAAAKLVVLALSVWAQSFICPAEWLRSHNGLPLMRGLACDHTVGLRRGGTLLAKLGKTGVFG